MDNSFYKTNFRFQADRYEEWQYGKCISSGTISTEIVAEVNGNSIHFEIDNINNIRILKSFDFDSNGDILQDRIQYVHATSDLNPIRPIVCHIFFCSSTIEYVRFAMSNPDRIVEFYGKLVELGQPSKGHKPQEQEETIITAESILNELSSYGMLNRDAIMERAVKLYNENADVATIEQTKKVFESLKLFVKAFKIHKEEDNFTSPKLLMFIALCNYKIGNYNQAYCIARQGLDAVDLFNEDSLIYYPKSALGVDTLNEIISIIETKYPDSLDTSIDYKDKDPLEIDSTNLERMISELSCTEKPSKSIIKKMIEVISNVQERFDRVAEQTGNVEKGLQLRLSLEIYKFPLYFAWQGYNYGLYTDWLEEGDSLVPLWRFELDLKKNTQSLIKNLISLSPFAQIEHDSSITNTLFFIYTSFINDIDNGTIKLL